MTIATRRDPEAVSESLHRWFLTRAGARAVAGVEVTPSKSGFSNETLMCRVRWIDAAEQSHDDNLVLRIEPTQHQLFPGSDALRQAAVMAGLASASDLPLPRVRFTESDAAWFGAAFYLMDRVDGNIPTDVPSYHKRGWIADMTVPARERLYDNAISALVELHRVDHRSVASILMPQISAPDFLADYIDHVAGWAAWADSDLRVNRPCIDAALTFINKAQPADTKPVVVWGDARIGNMIFGQDQSVVALLDWEAATIGPAGIDVGWWLMFEEYICEASGLSRLPGIPERDAILGRYEQLRGSTVVDVAYYEVLAALVFSLINSRLATLLGLAGFDEAAATKFVERSTGLLARYLDAANA